MQYYTVIHFTAINIILQDLMAILFLLFLWILQYIFYSVYKLYPMARLVYSPCHTSPDEPCWQNLPTTNQLLLRCTCTLTDINIQHQNYNNSVASFFFSYWLSYLTLKDRDSCPRLKITIIFKGFITFELLVLSKCFKKCCKVEISHWSQLDIQRLRSIRDYIITIWKHWFVKRNQCISSLWAKQELLLTLSPTPRTQIGSNSLIFNQ